MKTKDHTFKYLEQGVFKVKCKKTGGDFSTELWRLGKVKKNLCPCCNQIIH